MCRAGWSVVADAVIAVVIVGHVGVVMVHVVWMRVRMGVRVRGVIMLKTACTARLLSCNEAAATPGDSGAAAAAAAATSIAGTAAAIGIVAMYAHVPIEVARL